MRGAVRRVVICQCHKSNEHEHGNWSAHNRKGDLAQVALASDLLHCPVNTDNIKSAASDASQPQLNRPGPSPPVVPSPFTGTSVGLLRRMPTTGFFSRWSPSHLRV